SASRCEIASSRMVSTASTANLCARRRRQGRSSEDSRRREADPEDTALARSPPVNNGRRPLVIIVTLLTLCSSAVAHDPGAEFGDWFRSLKEPGTEEITGGSRSCCSPASDCQTTDYETDAEGRYWITTEGERIQVPTDKILQRADNPTGRGVACLSHHDGHPV